MASIPSIQSINNVTWVQVNPDIANNYFGNIEDYVINYLYASYYNNNNNLLIGAYNPNYPCYFLSILNISGGGGGGYYVSGGDVSGGWYTAFGNYYSSEFIPTITNTVNLECIYVNYSSGFGVSDTGYLTGNIINVMFDQYSETSGISEIYITSEDNTTNNIIFFTTICISSAIYGSYFCSYAIENNNQNIYYNSEIPYISPEYHTFTVYTNNWQNITNYVLNCQETFTFFTTVPSDTYNGIPNFTSVSTNFYGSSLVVSASDDTYGGIYYLQCPQGCSSYQPNTITNDNNYLMNGVSGIKFPLTDGNNNPITEWDYCTYQNLTVEIDISLNNAFGNYIICVENNIVYKIAFDFTTTTDYNSSNEYCSYEISNPYILNLSGEPCEITGNIISLISNVDAQNVVVFITSTQFFISNDTGNNFYYVPISEISESSTLTSCAISSGITNNLLIIYLGTSLGSINEVTINIS
jgi:hypothetical protein